MLRRYDEAEKAFARAEDMEPDDPGMRFHRASLYLYRDADTSKLRLMDTAILERRMPNPSLNIVAALYDGDFDTALRMLELWGDVEALPPSDNLRFAKPLWLAHTYAFAGRTVEAKPFFDTARERIEQRLAEEPDDPGLRLALGSVLAIAGGQNERAIENIRAALEHIDRLPPPVATEMRLDAAFAFANAGAVEPAVEQLDRYLSKPGEWSIEGLLRHPDLAGVRTDPRFLELVKKYGRAAAH
jgi:tetratricopeptide (TPR) repeat protein